MTLKFPLRVLNGLLERYLKSAPSSLQWCAPIWWRLTLTAPRLVVRALDDLNTMAGYARAQPGRVEQLPDLLSALLEQIAAVRSEARHIVSGGAELNGTAQSLDVHAVQIVDGGQNLVAVA